jgi:hypothetical protein
LILVNVGEPVSLPPQFEHRTGSAIGRYDKSGQPGSRRLPALVDRGCNRTLIQIKASCYVFEPLAGGF